MKLVDRPQIVSVFHLHLKKKRKKKKKSPPGYTSEKDYYYYLRYILDIDAWWCVPTGYVKKWVGFGNNYIHVVTYLTYYCTCM